LRSFEKTGYSRLNQTVPLPLPYSASVRAGKIAVVVVYKVDRLTRSLADFAKLVELFDQHGVSFVSITQSFNTTSSMGRLTLNVLLSFAQFERERSPKSRPIPLLHTSIASVIDRDDASAQSNPRSATRRAR
jgi:site-specific DNA recombinase